MGKGKHFFVGSKTSTF